MTYDNKTTLQTPLIGKVVILNKYILDKKPLPSKTIQRVYVEPMLSLGRVLYQQAIRELRGKDYLKRAIETVSDIQSSSFLVYSLKGWSEKVAAVIDVIEDYHEAKKRFDLGMRILKMTANVKKFYIQKVWAGVKWCGL